MTRKDLQKKYNIIGENNNIALYRKEGEYTHGIGYCGNIQLKNGKIVFNNKTYNDVDSLDKALREWEQSLAWPVDTYNPMIRHRANLESRIIWYLTEKLGFKHTIDDSWNVKYTRNVGPNCNISFSIERPHDLDDETVTLISYYGGTYYRSEVENAADAINVISTIVRESVLQMSSDMVDLLSIVPDTEVPNIEAYRNSSKNFFGIEKIDFKTRMIFLLENELKKLKGE